MRFFGNIFAWALAAIIAYVLASVVHTQVDLQTFVNMGVDLSLEKRWEATQANLTGLYLYGIVIAAGFAIGFFVASLVKAVLPFLSVIAYPVAGAAALALALYMMKWFLPGNEFPISSAQSMLGFWLQLACAAIGGVVFELARPKTHGR